jgi:hypothetical integral membrane protein (TIGR02206 family)
LRQFSPPHLAALAVLVILSVLAIWAPRRYPGRWVTAAERLLAAGIFAGWAGEYVADVVTHTWSVEYTLPLQLTDAVSVVAILALLTERQALIELVYFWSLTASLQAVLTPDLAQNFPSVYYFTYFIYHVGAIVAALLLVFGLRRYPRRGAALLVFAATLAWAAIAGTADVITGGNYMYLSEKPVHNSLLNVMGPWPWYIVTTGALGLGMLLVLELLTSWIRRRDLGTVAGRRASAPVQP